MTKSILSLTPLLCSLCLVAGLATAAFAESPRSSAPSPQTIPRTPEPHLLKQQLERILAQPDFQKAMQGGGADPRDVGQRLLLYLRRLLGQLGGLHQTNYALFIVAVVAGSMILLAIFVHIAYTIVQALQPRRGPLTDKQRPLSKRPDSPADFQRQAAALVERGAYREAVRALYLALLWALQIQGVLPRTSAQTNREHLYHLRTRPALAAIVEPFTETFDLMWYGSRPASREDVEHCRRWLEAAVRELEAE
ncbi:MAG: DUF4129 domain-containing protein [Candidatus Zipacnadales bacterium]